MRHTKQWKIEKLYIADKNDEKKSHPVFRATISQRPIAFVDRGAWRDITFKVRPHVNLFDGLSLGFDEMMTGGFPVLLKPDGALYRVRCGKTDLIMALPDANEIAAKLMDDDWVLYEEALPNCDIRMKNAGHRIPVEIDLKEGHPRRFRFKINYNVLGRRLLGSGAIRLPTGTLPRPVLKFQQFGEIVEKDIKRPMLLDWQINGDELIIELPAGNYAGWILDPTYTSQPDAANGKDTELQEEFPNTNYGNTNPLYTQRLPSGANVDMLIQWDISAIPAGSTIDAFEIDLYRSGNAGTDDVEWYRFLAADDAWTEGGATWNTLDGVNPWAGGTGPGDNLGVDISATSFYVANNAAGWPAAPNHVLFAGPVPNYAGELPDMTEFQAMFDDYHGMIAIDPIRGATGVNRNHQWQSSDSGTAAQRPKITIDYTPPAAQRLAYYTFSIWDPEARILDRLGNEVPPNELRADRYMSVLGMDLPTSKQYESYVEDPSKTKLVSIDISPEGARIVSNPNEYADIFLKRLGSGF